VGDSLDIENRIKDMREIEGERRKIGSVGRGFCEPSEARERGWARTSGLATEVELLEKAVDVDKLAYSTVRLVNKHALHAKKKTKWLPSAKGGGGGERERK